MKASTTGMSPTIGSSIRTACTGRAACVPPECFRAPKDWLTRIHPDDVPSYRAALVACFKGVASRFECDYRYLAQSDTWRWARQHGAAVRDAEGRVVRLIGSTGDITEL